jgi:hypothetical protein
MDDRKPPKVRRNRWSDFVLGYRVTVFRGRTGWRWMVKRTGYGQLGDCESVEDGVAKAREWIEANPLPPKK